MFTTPTMRAATSEPGQNELVFQTIPIPTPGPQQVLLKVAAAAVCHSDTFILSAAVFSSYLAEHLFVA